MKTLDRSIMVALSLSLSTVSLNARAAAAETPQSEQASAIANIVQKSDEDRASPGGHRQGHPGRQSRD